MPYVLGLRHIFLSLIIYFILKYYIGYVYSCWYGGSQQRYLQPITASLCQKTTAVTQTQLRMQHLACVTRLLRCGGWLPSTRVSHQYRGMI